MFSDKKLDVDGYSLLCVLLDGHIGIKKGEIRGYSRNFPIKLGLY